MPQMMPIYWILIFVINIVTLSLLIFLLNSFQMMSMVKFNIKSKTNKSKDTKMEWE